VGEIENQPTTLKNSNDDFNPQPKSAFVKSVFPGRKSRIVPTKKSVRNENPKLQLQFRLGTFYHFPA
jgi:hypothetical protein